MHTFLIISHPLQLLPLHFTPQPSSLLHFHFQPRYQRITGWDGAALRGLTDVPKWDDRHRLEKTTTLQRGINTFNSNQQLPPTYSNQTSFHLLSQDQSISPLLSLLENQSVSRKPASSGRRFHPLTPARPDPGPTSASSRPCSGVQPEWSRRRTFPLTCRCCRTETNAMQ